MTPYILLGRKKLPSESIPSPEHVYDERRQLWIDMNTGVPLVSCMRTQASQFGETSMTETREGADQTEGAVHAPEIEGMVESDVLQASRFGETTMTKAPEGTDTPVDASLYEFHAPYSHF